MNFFYIKSKNFNIELKYRDHPNQTNLQIIKRNREEKSTTQPICE